jgi:hypothetical protein
MLLVVKIDDYSPYHLRYYIAYFKYADNCQCSKLINFNAVETEQLITVVFA